MPGNFVWVQRVRIGNKNLISAATSRASWEIPPPFPLRDFLADGEVDSSVIDYRNNTNDKLGTTGPGGDDRQWITPLSPASRTALVDGQVYLRRGRLLSNPAIQPGRRLQQQWRVRTIFLLGVSHDEAIQA